MNHIVDRIIDDANAHEFTPQEARWTRIEAAARAVLDAYADPLVQSVGDSPALVELRAALNDPSPEPVRVVSEGAHTPGPWIVDGDGFVYDANGTREQPICDPRCFDSTGAGAMAEMDANARLIAAAPDMLAALKRAAPWLGKLIVEGVHEKCVLPTDARRTLDLVENAIAKATGGAQ